MKNYKFAASYNQWSIETGQEIQTITGQGYAFWNVSFNLDGKTFVSVSDDAKVEILTASAPETGQQMIIRGCNWLKDYLKNNVRVDKASRQICDCND
ncbi:hypothetical protein NIES2101_37740 [Calothrix sp. HK-06]|nr:hypothetical protein NIES2101_37740 [Calothrix sp. HK-06]